MSDCEGNQQETEMDDGEGTLSLIMFLLLELLYDGVVRAIMSTLMDKCPKACIKLV